MLIDRRDHTVNICEIKYTAKEFEINRKYDLELRNKIGTFAEQTACKKTLQLTFITPFGVRQNKYKGIVNNEVVLDDLF